MGTAIAVATVTGVDDAADLFDPQPGLVYLDSATYGLPPRPTVEALSDALRAWQAGTAYWIDDWDAVAETARREFAGLIGVPLRDVAMMPAASVGVGTVAAALGPGDRVVVPDDEFTSLLFPLLVAEQAGTNVTQVPFGRLVDSITDGTTLVATSLVQMQTGRVADLDAVVDRAQEVGSRVLVDTSHGLPFVGMGGVMARVDYMVNAAYKHLLCPRGVAFLVVRGDRHDDLPPWNANWRSATDPYGRYFGGPLTLADDAARFDVSPAWHAWLGASVSLGLVRRWSESGLLAAPLDRARELAAGLGVEWGGSTLVCVPIADPERCRAALEAGGIKAGFRGTAVRLSTHVYTSPAHVERAIEVIGPLAGG